MGRSRCRLPAQPPTLLAPLVALPRAAHVHAAAAAVCAGAVQDAFEPVGAAGRAHYSGGL